MSFHFAGPLLLRLPLFSTDAYTADPEKLLKDPLFRAAIFLASPVFYKRLATAGFTTGNLSAKERTTLNKYYNRCCFRPTPFGLFASVTPAEWGRELRISIAGNDDLQGIIQPDQAFVYATSIELTGGLWDRGRYETNPTIYRALKDYRFIRTDVTSGGERLYQLQSTDYSLVLKDLLNYCRQVRSPAEIIRRISQQAHSSPEESEDYFSFLTDAQVLIHQLRPRLTGDGYLSSISSELNKTTGQPDTDYEQNFLKVLGRRQLTTGNIGKFDRHLLRSFPHALTGGHHVSATMVRPVPDARLDSAYQQVIREGVFALDTLCSADEIPAMRQFLLAFRQHFEGQRIPLLAAIDPELGVGYQEPVAESPNVLLETLNIYPNPAPNSRTAWTPAHVHLMKCWLNCERQHETEIRLKTEDLQRLRGQKEELSTLGISVLFRVAQQKVFMESVGGNNALALIGRFTVANEAISGAARQMAREVEQINQQLIFAEILHLSDPHTDNVNRRESVWSYEIPITAAPSLPAKQRLMLNDLFVEVEGDKVFLWSEKHQKYVIPRLTTAYNHSLNKLPLFRFLADLPYQYGRSNLSFEFRSFFPGLSFYPRVEYGRAILSPATWILNAGVILPFQQSSDDDAVAEFKRIALSHKLPQVFAVAEGDQQLVFSGDRQTDILFFKEVIRQNNEIIIYEFISDGKESAVVRNREEHPFVNQFNGFILPDGPLLFPDGKKNFWPGPGAVRKFMPGTEWLYLKIYSPKLSAAKLLLKIWPLIKKKYRHGRVSKWFFVRYEDHAPHIRLRLKIDPLDISDILLAFRTLLDGHTHQHVIREYQLDIYNRELERYQAAGMELTENFFWSSSSFVIQYLRERHGKSQLPVHLAAVASVKIIANEILNADGEQLAFFRESYLGLLTEFAGHSMKQQLDRKYREFSGPIREVLHHPAFLLDKGMAAVTQSLQKNAASLDKALRQQEDGRMDYLRSIIHMHLNRLFTDQQRMQEMMIYYLLLKYMLSEEGRKRNVKS